MPRETWILNACLVTQDRARRVRLGHLRVVDGRIDRIASSRPSRISRGARVVDAAGLFILPGFVQAHVHLCQTLFRNQADDLELLDWLSKRIWVFEGAHTPSTLRASALLGIHELLSSGTTCLLDMGTVRHTEEIFKAVERSGIRANVGKCLMDHPRNTPPYLREATAPALAEAVALHARWNGAADDRIRASFAPRFVISCTEGLMKEVARLSRETGAIIHTHASENRKEIELVRKQTGRENVAYLDRIGVASERLVLAHCIWLSEAEMKALKRTGTHAVHCPSSNMKLASGFARVPELRKRGINVALGADGAPCNNNLDMFTEMRLAALIHKPGYGPREMRAVDVLDMATRDGARALAWDAEIGSIEVGKRADLIALDLSAPENAIPAPEAGSSRRPPSLEAIASSIVYSTRPSHLRWTMVDGRTVYENGRVTTISRTDLMSQVRAAQLEIARRAARLRGR